MHEYWDWKKCTFCNAFPIFCLFRCLHLRLRWIFNCLFASWAAAAAFSHPPWPLKAACNGSNKPCTFCCNPAAASLACNSFEPPSWIAVRNRALLSEVKGSCVSMVHESWLDDCISVSIKLPLDSFKASSLFSVGDSRVGLAWTAACVLVLWKSTESSPIWETELADSVAQDSR